MAGVDPFGLTFATVAKNGTLMGNRGILRKDGSPAIVRQWQGKRWVYCTCEGERIDVAYTKLFFLDETTALSAGHRPCQQCLRERHYEFKAAWVAGNPEHGFDLATQIEYIDKILDEERKSISKGKGTYVATLGALPDGVMVSLVEDPAECWLYHGGFLRRWSHSGYTDEIVVDAGVQVIVLTPRSTVNAIRSGFKPLPVLTVHRAVTGG